MQKTLDYIKLDDRELNDNKYLKFINDIPRRDISSAGRSDVIGALVFVLGSNGIVSVIYIFLGIVSYFPSARDAVLYQLLLMLMTQHTLKLSSCTSGFAAMPYQTQSRGRTTYRCLRKFFIYRPAHNTEIFCVDIDELGINGSFSNSSAR